MVSLSSSTFIRIASVVTLLYCLGHMSGYPWTPGATLESEAVITQMRKVIFEAEGATRSYWDFYFGFGLIVGAFLGVQSFALWGVAAIARRDARIVVPILVVFVVGFLVNAYLSSRYFFALPAVFSLVIAALLVAASWRARA